MSRSTDCFRYEVFRRLISTRSLSFQVLFADVDGRFSMVDRVSVVRSRSDQLSIHGTDAGSATLSEFRTFPVGGVVTSLVEDVSEAI